MEVAHDRNLVQVVIGMSGRIAAGKTTIARHIERRGFAYTRFSLIIDDEIRSRGLPLNRATRQAVGYELHRARGQRWLGRQILDHIPSGACAIVDGLRWSEDAHLLREHFGQSFTHVHVEADPTVREERYRSASGEDAKEFRLVDGDPVEQEIDSLAALADLRVLNNSTLTDLAHLADAIIDGSLAKARGDMRCRSL